MDLMFLIVAFGAIIYFLIWRPQKQEEADRKKLIDSLAKGDKIIMNNGIHGSIASVSDTTLRVQIASKVEITVDKTVIASKVETEKGK